MIRRLRLRRRDGFRGRRADGDVGAHFRELRFGDATDGEQVLDSPEAPGFLAELNDGFGSGGADAGEFFKFFGAGEIDVDGMFGRRFLCRRWRGGSQEQGGAEGQ